LVFLVDLAPSLLTQLLSQPALETALHLRQMVLMLPLLTRRRHLSLHIRGLVVGLELNVQIHLPYPQERVTA